jgi:hypothetical protein
MAESNIPQSWSAHLRYGSYVARHKWFVFRAGLKTGAPLWRLVIHDWSKLTPAEWGPYVRTFYAKHKARPGEFDKAWLHHQHRNPHHWQHWLLREDDGDLKVLPMPEKFVREMVADWMGAGRAITGQWGATDWYLANFGRIVLDPETRKQVHELLGLKSHDYRLREAA